MPGILWKFLPPQYPQCNLVTVLSFAWKQHAELRPFTCFCRWGGHSWCFQTWQRGSPLRPAPIWRECHRSAGQKKTGLVLGNTADNPIHSYQTHKNAPWCLLARSVPVPAQRDHQCKEQNQTVQFSSCRYPGWADTETHLLLWTRQSSPPAGDSSEQETDTSLVIKRIHDWNRTVWLLLSKQGSQEENQTFSTEGIKIMSCKDSKIFHHENLSGNSWLIFLWCF